MQETEMDSSNHDHQHSPNRFAVIPTPTRLNANPEYTGKGVTVAFLDSSFYPHPDLVEPVDRILAFKDVSGETQSLHSDDMTESWRWHGTQTSVVAAGNGQLSDGTYQGLASKARLVLVKASERGRITEDNIARGIKWIIDNREQYNIRVLNISLGGDEDVPCSKSVIDQAAEEAIRNGIAVVAAAGNSGDRHSIPPANSPFVITVGGYHDNNQIDGSGLDLYHSNFGMTADGTVKPEIVAPAMWVAAPILPGTTLYDRAEALSHLSSAPDYQLQSLARELEEKAELPESLRFADAVTTRRFVDETVVAGDFNGWSETASPLRKDSSGLWLAEVKTPPVGRYQYKFIVNGNRWTEDPNNGMKAPDGYGGLNSLLVIE
jgi:serine protease AprX